MPPRLTRREFIATLALSAAALSLPGVGRAAPLGPAGPVPVDRQRFPQSVASGDPRPDRVLLWTRIESTADTQRLLLQVAELEDFSGPLVERELHAERAHDHCVRVRLTDLSPGQTLHYRFLREHDGGWIASPTGRTRSAPAADANVPVRFAFMSCQDYGGRWYNTLLPLLDQELDFVLHLGDFIYETVGDPGFQSRDGERAIAFDDLAGALRLGDDEAPYYAARSLDNYRQLHRTVRTDPVLQRLLERAPLVAIWDDHEFADDCWQDSATHFDGRVDEADRERRRNSEQAWLEYLPVDHDDTLADDAHAPRESLFPQLRIWRRLRFGRHLDLFLTDTRSERPDHLIPEDAFPGTVLYDREELHQRLPALGLDPAAIESALVPWIDLDRPERAALRQTLQAALAIAYGAEGQDAAHAQRSAANAAGGRIAWPVLDAALAQWNARAPEPMRVPAPPAQEADGTGLAWLSLGKTELFGSLGARYMVLADCYDALAALRGRDGGHNPVSERQWRWLETGLADSDASWKAVASSISLTPILLDLSLPGLDVPAPMRRRFLLNVDHWDGFPLARRDLVENLFARAGNVVALSGDIHAAFVSQHGPRASEFTVPAVSSTTLADILAREAERDAANAEATRRLVAGLDPLVAAGDARIRHVQTRVHGLCVAQLDGDGFRVELLAVPPELCRRRLYDSPRELEESLVRHRFRIAAEDGQVQSG